MRKLTAGGAEKSEIEHMPEEVSDYRISFI